jgi:hypothetical protein
MKEVNRMLKARMIENRWYIAAATQEGLRKFPDMKMHYFVRRSGDRVCIFSNTSVDVPIDEAGNLFNLTDIATSQAFVKKQYHLSKK